MNKLIIISAVVVLFSCTQIKDHDKIECNTPLLELSIDSINQTPNELIEFSNSEKFIELKDTVEFLKFEKKWKANIFLEKSELDSTKRKYSYKVLKPLFKTEEYEVAVFMLKNNDSENGEYTYWVKTYNQTGENIGHIDFANWSSDDSTFHSGIIDCDTILHMIIPQRNEHRTFKIETSGKIKNIEINKTGANTK